MYAVSNEEAGEAGRLFESLEGCDLDPAAEVALAGLVRAVAQGKVRRKESVLLNLTGGGARRLVRDDPAHPRASRTWRSPEPGHRPESTGRVVESAARSERMSDLFDKCTATAATSGPSAQPTTPTSPSPCSTGAPARG